MRINAIYLEVHMQDGSIKKVYAGTDRRNARALADVWRTKPNVSFVVW